MRADKITTSVDRSSRYHRLGGVLGRRTRKKKKKKKKKKKVYVSMYV